MKNINQVKQNLKADDFKLADDEARNHFIDEAVEILQQMDVNLPQWTESPTDIGILAGIRRGFRTLNSSSRNVGANSVGEVAWSVESLLNAVVDADIEVSDVIVEFVTEAKYNVPYLINDFANDDIPSVDIATLVLKSENLKSSRDINDGFEDENIDITKSATDDSTTYDSTITASSESDTPDDKLTLNLSETNSEDDKNEGEKENEGEKKDGEVSSTKFETPASAFDSSVLKKNGLFSDQGFNENTKSDNKDRQTDSEPKKVESDKSDNAKESSEENANPNNDANKINSDTDNESSNDGDNKDSDSKNQQETPKNKPNDVDNAEATDEKAEEEKADDKTSDVSEDDNGVSDDTDEDLIAKTNSKLKKETTKARVENPDYKKSLSNVTLEHPKETSNSNSSKSLVWITIGVILFIACLGIYSTTL